MKKLVSILLSMALLMGVIAPCAVSAASTDGNDEAATATKIKNGAITGVFETADDEDWYKFETTKDYFVMNFRVNDKFLGADTKHGWKVILYKKTDKLEELKVVTTTDAYTFPIIPMSGTFYIKVVRAGNEYYSPVGIDYDIKITQTTDAYWESEGNNSATTANSIKANKTYYGSLHVGSDEDWYKVTTSDYFTVELSVDDRFLGEDVDDGWDVKIYDNTKTTLLGSLDDVETKKTSRILAYKGTVYIKVNRGGFYEENAPTNIYYNLKVNNFTKSKWEKEHNNDSKTATTISQGSVYTGTLYKETDVDYYKFKSTTNAFKLRFSISLDEVSLDEIQDGWRISLFRQDSGEEITAFTVDTIGSFESATLPLEKGKYYYIKVKPVDDDDTPCNQIYHISVVDATAGKSWEKENLKNGKNDFANATALAESKTIYGNTGYNGDQDYYKLSVATGGNISITFKRPESNEVGDGYYIQLFDASGKAVTDKYNAVKLTEKYTGISVSKGNYYLVLYDVTGYGKTAPTRYVNYSISYTLTPAKPTVKSVVPGTKAIKLTWGKRSDVTGYEIQYATNANFKSAKKVKLTKDKATTTLKSLTANKTYYVRIRTYTKTSSKTYYSAWVTKSVKTTVAAPKLSSLTAGTKSFKAAWSKNSNATGYEIQYSTSSNFKSAKTIKVTKSNLNKTLKNLSAKKTYYVRVRACVKLDKTYYSAWSAYKKIKTK